MTPQPSLGPRKIKETSWVIKNTDPLLPKNKKPKVIKKANPVRRPMAQSDAKGKCLHTASIRSSSVEPEYADTEILNPSSPRSSVDVIDVPDDGDDPKVDDPAPACIDVDAEDETLKDSTDEELRACTTYSSRNLLRFL
jgi:hypothetical protein